VEGRSGRVELELQCANGGALEQFRMRPPASHAVIPHLVMGGTALARKRMSEARTDWNGLIGGPSRQNTRERITRCKSVTEVAVDSVMWPML
jgi:hypothetical protein